MRYAGHLIYVGMGWYIPIITFIKLTKLCGKKYSGGFMMNPEVMTTLAYMMVMGGVTVIAFLLALPFVPLVAWASCAVGYTALSVLNYFLMKANKL